MEKQTLHHHGHDRLLKYVDGDVDVDVVLQEVDVAAGPPCASGVPQGVPLCGQL